MKRKIIHWVVKTMNSKGLLTAGALILLMAMNAHATITYTNPNFKPDDHSQVFTPCTCISALEWYDYADKTLGLNGSTFGFFYWGTDVTKSENLVTVFDSNDVYGDGTPDKAKIDFVNGKIYDTDPNSTWYLERTFTPIAGGHIGFFLQTDPDLYAHDLFTVAAYNPGGIDAAATMPHITAKKTYLIGFEIPNSNPSLILGAELVSGITPFAISEPGTLALMVLGLTFVGVFSIKSLVRKTTG